MVQPPQQVTFPQHVPVRVTNRNQSQTRQRVREHIHRPSNISADRSSQGGQNRNRTLLIGDYILNGINYRGLKTYVRFVAKAGASINDIWNEISVYDMKSFTNIIICVRGNDCSRGMDTHFLEDKYDQLISLIRSSNKD